MVSVSSLSELPVLCVVRFVETVDVLLDLEFRVFVEMLFSRIAIVVF